MTSTSLWLWTATAFYAFFVFGFSDNLKGPILPDLLRDLQIDYTLGSSILLGLYLGFMAATLTTGPLADRLGKRAVLLLAGFSLAVGAGGFSTFSAPLLLGLSMFVLGYGLGALELGCNALIIELHPGNQGRFLSLMSVMHGIGSMSAPFFAGLLLAAGASWRTVYRGVLPLTGLLLALTAFQRRHTPQTAPRAALDLHRIGRTAFTPRMVWLYTAIIAYVAAEIGIASWLVEYLQTARGQNVEASTGALSLYFGLMMAGRLVGSFFLERLGYLRAILLAMLAALACLALGLLGPASALALTGFFFSIVFPAITAAASKGLTENAGTALGLLFTFAGLGGMAGPWLVGFAADHLGLTRAFWLNAAFALVTTLAALALLALQRHNPSGPRPSD